MDENDLARFEKLLKTWLADLLHQANDTVMGLRKSDDFIADPLDQAAIESERSYQLRIRTRESTLINKIRQSLMDIEEGSYGICEICGGEISIKRLEARPIARHCIKCKTMMENREKLTGT